MKNKAIALMGAIVLCSLFLVALPATAIATEQDDYVLGIYGNANEDDTIDMRDLTYVKLIFFGKKPEMELADAKYDGKINPLDFIQIKLIIVGKEKELTIVDSADRIVTVKKPIERIIMLNTYVLETIRSIKATDSVVGVYKSVIGKKIFFPEFSDYPSVGSYSSPDIEKVLELRPDVVFLYATTRWDNIQNTLEAADPSMTVLRFNCYRPYSYVEETKKMGYVLNKVEETDEFLDFYQGNMNTINEQVEELSEEDKPNVYIECWRAYNTATKKASYGQKIEQAGGNNIFAEEIGEFIDVDAEAVIMRDPEIILWTDWTTGGYELDAGNTALFEEVRGKIMNGDALKHVTAVENEKVYIIANHIIDSPRHFVGIGYFAKWFHPDLFEDLDPKATHQRYLTEFQGLDIDLDEQGVFVYPEPS